MNPATAPRPPRAQAPTACRPASPARRPALRSICGGALLLLAGLAPAPADAATRPYAVTESAVALAPGAMRLEAGLSREEWDDGAKVYALTTEFSYSLYANLDLEAEVPWVVAGVPGPGPGLPGAFDDGLGDIRTRAKINFVKERVAIPLTLSGLLEVKFPTGINLVSTDEVDVRLAGLASKDFGPVTVHGNGFYTFVGGNQGGAQLKDVAGLSVGVAAQTPVEELTGVGEFVWEQARISGRDPRLEVMGGARLAVAPRLTLDATVRVGFSSGVAPSEGAPDYTLGLGLTWNLSR